MLRSIDLYLKTNNLELGSTLHSFQDMSIYLPNYIVDIISCSVAYLLVLKVIPFQNYPKKLYWATVFKYLSLILKETLNVTCKYAVGNKSPSKILQVKSLVFWDH